MKKQITYFLLNLLLLTACKENTDPAPGNDGPDNANPPAGAGAIQPVGAPAGVPVIKNIGPAGGTIASQDGRFTVTVPAGALDKEVAISMQPITNTNGSGIGSGYRMLPDGQQFIKPVSMIMSYSDEEIEGTIPEALGIAYQNTKGVWMSVVGVQLDKDRKKASIEVSHFTDFTFFKYVYLDPEYSAIDPGQSVKIKAYALHSINMLASTLPKGREVGLPKPTAVEYIDGWEVQGEGSLQGTGKEVLYLAPGQIPNVNPARVILKLKSPGTEVAQLISRIYVAPEGLSLQAGGGEWKHFGIAGANLSGGIKGIDARNGEEIVNIKWQGGTGPRNAMGIFNWTKTTVTAMYRPDGITQYMQFYGLEADVSGGSLKVDNMRFGILMGSFDVQTAGLYVASNPPVITTSTMRGVFRVKCLDCGNP